MATPNSRRSFLKNISAVTAILLTGDIRTLSAAEWTGLRKKLKLRFAVASDAHYGQPNTAFDEMIEKLTGQVNAFHDRHPLDFTVINGDLIHNEKPLMALVKQKTDALQMPYYVTRGNHDMVTEQEWASVWQTPLNQDIVLKDTALILADTSNEKGVYLAPDLVWLAKKLEEHRARKTLLFLHIPQAKWTANGIDTPAFFELVNRYPNIKAVFHGHEHDQDGVKMNAGIPYFFDSHIGGNWGTDYRGFRVVELMADGTLVTYMMNPSQKLNELSY
ncbi:MAG: metallophosphoesterase [Chitinophagaceae bacterium]|nr:metallophosphoesterase [Chitinophagaceae bacterium]